MDYDNMQGLMAITKSRFIQLLVLNFLLKQIKGNYVIITTKLRYWL